MKKGQSQWSTMLTGANGRISSKRVLGCFILLVLLAVMVVCVFVKPDITWLGEAFITMMVGAFALLGIGVFEKRFKTPLPDESQTVEEESGDGIDDEADHCA